MAADSAQTDKVDLSVVLIVIVTSDFYFCHVGPIRLLDHGSQYCQSTPAPLPKVWGAVTLEINISFGKMEPIDPTRTRNVVPV